MMSLKARNCQWLRNRNEGEREKGRKKKKEGGGKSRVYVVEVWRER